MLKREEIPRVYKKICHNNRTTAYRLAYCLLNELPLDIKTLLERAFVGPSGLGYQDPIELVNVARIIVENAILVVENKISTLNPTLDLFERVHHDHTGFDTSFIVGIIKKQIPKAHWEANVDWFDGAISINHGIYAFVELGWILPRKVRELLDYPKVEELWLFPYKEEEGYEIIAPYYFIFRKGPKWRQIIEEDFGECADELRRVEGITS